MKEIVWVETAWQFLVSVTLMGTHIHVIGTNWTTLPSGAAYCFHPLLDDLRMCLMLRGLFILCYLSRKKDKQTYIMMACTEEEDTG